MFCRQIFKLLYDDPNVFLKSKLVLWPLLSTSFSHWVPKSIQNHNSQETTTFFWSGEINKLTPPYKGVSLIWLVTLDDLSTDLSFQKKVKNKNALYLSVKVFSTKVLIGDINFSLQLETGPPFLRGHPNHVKVKPLAVQREYLHFSFI